MAFLRSSKFLGIFQARKNLVNFRGSVFAHQSGHRLYQHRVCLYQGSYKNFATVSDINSYDTLEKLLRRLDDEVRRSGRIKTRDLEEILEGIRNNKSATSIQSLVAIRFCGSYVPEMLLEVRTKMVQKIWKTLSELNVSIDISHYNALLRVYLENEYKFSPNEFLADLEAKGIEPNCETYQRIISSYCQQGDINGATKILELMREKQMPVNEIVYNALIMGHSNCFDFESAVGILRFMIQDGLNPSADTYKNLLCGFARVGDMRSIEEFIEQSQREKISLLDKDFLEVIYTLAVNGHETKIDEVLPRLEKSYGYNRDIINVSLRLINQGQDSAAMKLVKSMNRLVRQTGELAETGHFLVRQLIRLNNRPIEQIIKFCNELEELGMHSKPLLIAVETAFLIGKIETSKTLLKELNNKGVEIRQHYFWPIIRQAKSEEEIIDIFKMMEKDFNMSPNNQTLREYVIPKILKNDDYANVIKTLIACGVSLGRVAAESAAVAISNNHLSKAADIMNHYDTYYAPSIMLNYLTKALCHSKDFQSYVKIIRSIVDNLDRSNILKNRNHEIDENIQSLKERQAEVVGHFLIDALLYFKSNRVEVGEKILHGLVDQGLSINSNKATRIYGLFGKELTHQLSTLLKKLASGELKPIPVERQERKHFPSSEMSKKTPEEFERLIATINERGGKADGLKRKWLISTIQSKNVAKIKEIVSQLKLEGFIIGTGDYAQIIELYATEDRPDEALQILRAYRETNPKFVLDEAKMIKIAQSLVNKDRIDEAIKFVKMNKAKETKVVNPFILRDTCLRLLNSLAAKGKIDELNKLFETLVASGYVIPNSALLDSIIKIHHKKNDVKAADEKFEEICQKY